MDRILAEGKVKSYLLPFPDGTEVKILGWTSLRPGNGNTKVALEELKKEFDTITVFGVHHSNSNALNYWKYMKSIGLIDKISDEDGNIIT